jgi:AraC-like DNA-binding protein
MPMLQDFSACPGTLVPLTLTYHLPPDDLLPFVAGGYVVSSDESLVESEISSLLGQLHWVLEGLIEYDTDGGYFRPVPRRSVIGPTTRSPDVRFHGPFKMVGVGLLPAGWQRWLRVPASEARDLIHPMQAIAPQLAAEFDRFDPALPDELLAGQMYAALMRALPPQSERERVALAIDRWLIADARDIGALAGDLGISHRQLNRLALDTHGAPLRLLGTKWRTLRCAARLAGGAASHWSEAMTDEFCDQPHLIHSFRRFIGTTPRGFLSAQGEFNREIMRERLRIRPDNPLAAWG